MVTLPRLVLGTHGPFHGFLGLGKTIFEAADVAFHKHVLGLTGQGKSKAIASYALQLFEQGIPFCLVDPHAELADDVLRLFADRGHFPGNQPHPRLAYIDFSRRDRFLPFNVLSQPYPVDQVAKNLGEVAERVWPNLAGGNAPTFKRLFTNTIKLLIHNALPLTYATPLLTNKPLREALLASCPDVWVHRFFRDSFDNWKREEERMKESTVNRCDLFIDTDVMRLSLGQPETALNFRELMDTQTSLIVNLNGLSVDEWGFLGAFITHGFEKAAYARGAPGSSRAPYHLILDEAPMYTGQSETTLAAMLSRTRKYGLSVWYMHQTLSQASTRLLNALQNAQLLAFGLGRIDARIIAQDLVEFDPEATKEATVGHGDDERTIAGFVPVPEAYQRLKDVLKSLPPRHVYVQTRTAHHRFRTLTVPPFRTTAAQLQALKDAYAEQLMTPVHAVRPVVDWSYEPVMGPAPTAPPKRRSSY